MGLPPRLSFFMILSFSKPCLKWNPPAIGIFIWPEAAYKMYRSILLKTIDKFNSKYDALQYFENFSSQQWQFLRAPECPTHWSGTSTLYWIMNRQIVQNFKKTMQDLLKFHLTTGFEFNKTLFPFYLRLMTLVSGLG